MALQQNPKVRVKSVNFQNLAEGQDQPSQTNPRGDLLFAQSLSPNAELVRLGNSFYVMQSTAVAPVAALPTTTAQLGLYNNEQAGGKIYVIDSLMASVVVTGATGGEIGLAVQVSSASQVPAVPATASLTIRGLSGRPYNGNAVVGVGTTVPAGPWMPWGTTSPAPGTTSTYATQAIDVPVNGSIIILPGGNLGVSCMSGVVATITTVVGVRWHEVLLPYN